MVYRVDTVPCPCRLPTPFCKSHRVLLLYIVVWIILARSVDVPQAFLIHTGGARMHAVRACGLFVLWYTLLCWLHAPRQ